MLAASKRVRERPNAFIDRGFQLAKDVVVAKELVGDNRNAYETLFARIRWGKSPGFVSGYADFRAGRRPRAHFFSQLRGVPLHCLHIDCEPRMRDRLYDRRYAWKNITPYNVVEIVL